MLSIPMLELEFGQEIVVARLNCILAGDVEAAWSERLVSM